MTKKKGTFEKKLKAYSVVAAGTLLLAPSANAAIQYSGPQSLPVIFGPPQVINLDGDVTDDFNIGGFLFTVGTTTGYGIGIFPAATGRSFINSTPNILYPTRNLATNYSINSGANYWSTFVGALAYQVYTATGSFQTGNFNGDIGCIGVRFDVGAAAPDYRYGWISYNGASHLAGEITGWAYEDTGAPILAGAGGPPGVCAPAPTIPVPTLNQWGLFALITLIAGAGVMKLRKQEEV